MTYEFGPCTSITVEADSDDAAVGKALDMSSSHFAEYHAGETVPPREQLEPMLRQLMHSPA